MSYGLTLTTVGAAEIAAAYQTGTVVTITTVELGDCGGVTQNLTPDQMAARTALAGAFGEEPFSDSQPDEGIICGEFVIDCGKYPGRVFREMGLRSSVGTLIAYGLYPDTYLPAQSDSIIKEIIVTAVLALTHAESVTLQVDPNRRILTERTADSTYLRQDRNLSDVRDHAQARTHLEVYSKTESDLRYEPIDSAYTKLESDLRYEPIDSAYTKQESDLRYEPIDSAYTKLESDQRYEPIDSAYTKLESDQRYVAGVSLGAEGAWDTRTATILRVPAGHVLTGTHSNYNDANWELDTIYFKPLQRLINGVWYTVPG